MKKVFYKSFILLFGCFSLYLMFCGIFGWNGGNALYEQMNVPLRGILMSATILLLYLSFGRWMQRWCTMDEKKRRYGLMAGCIIAVAVQILFVTAAQAGIRYDALKCFDEAVALFHQNGIGAEDLDGYFARYSNNYGITIMTHLLLKIMRFLHILDTDFSGGVLALQYCNILFVDLAFAGMWMIIRKWISENKADVFLWYMICNPLSYVWLPFYYTNTVSMAFAVWGMWFFFRIFESGRSKRICSVAASAVLFAGGFYLRATTAIPLIACILSVLCIFCVKCIWKSAERRKKIIKLLIYIGTFCITMMLTTGVCNLLEKRYIVFDNSDTKFPITHWVAMGLSDTGTYSPLDEAETMSYATQEEKKAATIEKIKTRFSEKGFFGVVKLYMKKFSDTFADGAGGYFSELYISKNYDTLWQIVYGVYKDPLLWLCQAWYMISIAGGGALCIQLWTGVNNDRKKAVCMTALLLSLFGSWIFQMIWEAGSIYSIGTMYLSGAMASMLFSEQRVAEGSGKRRSYICAMTFSLIGTCAAVVLFLVKDYVDVEMSVDQFLYQSPSYISLEQGERITQTFETDKEFSVLSLMVQNQHGDLNNSTYRITLSDEEGNCLQSYDLDASDMMDYQFYAMPFSSVEGNEKYKISIEKIKGKHSLTFLYYNTGNYDVYSEGIMTGPMVQGNMADLVFRIYDREEGV